MFHLYAIAEKPKLAMANKVVVELGAGYHFVGNFC
jgi:hypothetical protein